MNHLTFKTTINCGGCISKVKETLNQLVGENNWKVDTSDTNKILKITNDTLSAQEIIKSVKELGFEIEILENN